jgi:photosystem II stability/assembly factor-like uncharacterized protein
MRDKTDDQQRPLTSLPASLKHRTVTPGKYISTLLRLTAILVAATLTTHAKAQWDIEESHTTASLRGIHNVGGGVAWASGTHGTVLRTEDGGYLWQTCNIPPGAENLDFRGIQAFDENTAIVMSSGPGDQSRIYKTTDGCQSWKLLFTNPDKEGFWDAIQFSDSNVGYLLGDPVDHHFVVMRTDDGGTHWFQLNTISPTASLDIANEKLGAFAASNSALILMPSANGLAPLIPWFGTSGPGAPLIFEAELQCTMMMVQTAPQTCLRSGWAFARGKWIVSNANSGAGVFSIAKTPTGNKIVAVGGDYQKPDNSAGIAAWGDNLEFNPDGWVAAKTQPHGYRSSVAYDPTQKLWITVGPNGTDISTDDGKNWQPLKPTNQDPADADKNWNALSLPFVVGPNGRIGRLRTITPPSTKPQVAK